MLKCNLLKFYLQSVWNFHNKIVCRMQSVLFFGTAKKDCVIKIKEMFSSLFLIIDLVTIGLRFLLLSKSAIISLKAIYILYFLFRLYSSIFLIL